MASNSFVTPWRLTLPEGIYKALQEHLFPGDNDEHGAIILAGICQSDRGLRLIARELHWHKTVKTMCLDTMVIGCCVANLSKAGLYAHGI